MTQLISLFKDALVGDRAYTQAIAQSRTCFGPGALMQLGDHVIRSYGFP